MLLEFGFKNFFSFREGASISFKLDANCPESISGGRTFATAMAIKGANGSGKTQILKALSFLAIFCSKSFGNEPEAELPFSRFFESKEPTEFYAEFVVGDVTYTYELTCSETEVLAETIHQKKAKRVKVYERRKGEAPFATKQFEKLKQVKLRSNASIISTAHQYELKELEPVYHFFKNIVTNVGYSGWRALPVDLKTVSKYLNSSASALKFVNDFIAQCDVGIAEIVIQSSKPADGEEEFHPIFLHESADVKHAVTQYTESSGTKAVFSLLPLIQAVLGVGGVLAIDEFDVHLHPHILPKLLDLFLDDETNDKHAQILFTTHDSEILDLLGKYRVYLCNKRDNESFVYRLDEIPGDVVRNDRPIRPVYENGKIGGVPRI